jgi:hypothetical protein
MTSAISFSATSWPEVTQFSSIRGILEFADFVNDLGDIGERFVNPIDITSLADGLGMIAVAMLVYLLGRKAPAIPFTFRQPTVYLPRDA